MVEEATDKRWADPEYWREMYMRKAMVEAGQHRVLLVIAGGHGEPRRLAQEIVMSAGGVTDEILDSPMWKFGTDEAYYVTAERAEGRENPVRVDRHDAQSTEGVTIKDHVRHNFQDGQMYCMCGVCVSAARLREHKECHAL